MKFGRLGDAGHEFPVVFLDGQTAVSVSHLVSDWSRDALINGALQKVAGAPLTSRPAPSVAGHRVAAPLQRPGKIIGIGLNYQAHATETGASLTDEPLVFMKSPDCVVELAIATTLAL